MFVFKCVCSKLLCIIVAYQYLFLLLCKLGKYCGDVKVKFTMMDTFCDQKTKGASNRILSHPYADIIKMEPSDLVQDYPHGCYLACNTPWVLVDHVLIMMNVGEHWILTRFDIKRRALFVYNSLRSGVDDAMMMCEMQRMTVVIAYLLLLLDFYDKCPKVDLNSPYYKNKVEDATLDIFFVDGLPQQTYW